MSSKNKTKEKAHHPKKDKQPQPFTVNKSLVRTLCFVLGLIAFTLYVNTFNHGYVLDDHSVIRENTLTKGGIKNIGKILQSPYRDGFGSNGNDLFRPLSKVMFAIEWDMAPNNPKPGHIINAILYSLTCILLFIVLVRYIKINVFILFAATLLFAVHPIHTEVVANIKSRDEILAMIFLLLSMLLIHHHINKSNKISLALSLVMFFLALLSKESAIVYVGIVFLIIHFFTEQSLKKNIIITALFASVGLIYIFIHIKLIGNLGIPNVPVVDNSLMATDNFLHRRLTAIYILGKYLLLLIFPHPLSSDYSYNTIPLVTSIGSPGFLLSFAVHGFMLWYAIKNFKKKNLIAFCILFYLVSISITSNVFMIIGTNMAERLLYFPSVGFCLSVAILGAKAFKIDFNATLNKLPEIIKAGKAMTFILIAIAIIFSAKTFSRNKDWLSDGTLFNTDVEKVPNSAHMLFYTANHLMNKDSLKLPDRDKRIALAEKHIKKALKIYDLFPDALEVAGRVATEYKRFDEAMIYYQQSTKLNPNSATTHNNLGTCYFNTAKLDEALYEFRLAEKLDNDYADASFNLGSTYGTMGENYLARKDFDKARIMFDSAIYQFNKTINIDPSYASAYRFLGFTYRTLGDSVNFKKYMSIADQMPAK